MQANLFCSCNHRPTPPVLYKYAHMKPIHLTLVSSLPKESQPLLFFQSQPHLNSIGWKMSSMNMYALLSMAFFLSGLMQLAHGQVMAPSPMSDGKTIDQGIAYVLMLVALLVAYLVHWFALCDVVFSPSQAERSTAERECVLDKYDSMQFILYLIHWPFFLNIQVIVVYIFSNI